VPAASDVVAAQAADLADAIERMRDLRRFVGDVIRELPDPLLVTDEAGIVTLANSAAHALLGDDIVGRAKAPLSPLADGSLEIDGRCFILTRAALRDADDVQRGWIVRLADISAIRDAEREREALLEFLSHDMRSPQASILALIDHDGQSAVRPDIATRIRGYAHRTLTLADNFVQLARVSATPFRPEPVSLGDVLAEAADDLWTQADRRGIRIVCAEADSVPALRRRKAAASAARTSVSCEQRGADQIPCRSPPSPAASGLRRRRHGRAPSARSRGSPPAPSSPPAAAGRARLRAPPPPGRARRRRAAGSRSASPAR
jgi:hypothetical protein